MRFRVPLSMLVAATLACGDGHGPRPFTAAFALSTVNGSSPPVLVGATLNCDQYLDAALLQLNEDGTFSLNSQSTLDCTGTGGGESGQPGSLAGTYTRSGSTLSLQVPGGPLITLHYARSTISGSLPAGSSTFPTPIDVVLIRLLPL